MQWHVPACISQVHKSAPVLNYKSGPAEANNDWSGERWSDIMNINELLGCYNAISAPELD